MNKSVDISNFKNLNIPEKIDFLGGNFFDDIKELDDKALNISMRNIILDANENNYVRKLVLESYTELIILGRLKIRHGLTLLIDDWVSSDDIFLELQRLKDLLLYYEVNDKESSEIEVIFETSAENSEAEIVGESYMNLGIVSFRKALWSLNEGEYKTNLDKGEYYFQKSLQEIENRVDSQFYQKVIFILKELIYNKWESATLYLKELGDNLFQKEGFSFNYDFDNIQYGLYKILISLEKICIQKPRNWIDYRFELGKMYMNYIEITNSKINKRLNKKDLIEKLGEHLKGRILEPYFIVNLNAQIIKIEILLNDKIVGSAEYDFLLYLKSIIENSDKKKIEFESLELEFTKLFPTTSPQIISNTISDIKDSKDYLRAFELLSKKDNNALIGHLIFACSKLQGDKKYWGKKVNENDRNRFIATILESAGFTIKDQPQWSISTEGKDSGEIDVFITEPNGTPKSIIEALILDSLKQDYLILHLDKLFRYDTTGLENNYIITYSLAKKFDLLWTKYQRFISNHNYTFDFIEFKEIIDWNFTDIKIGVAHHSRNGKIINLFHIMVNLVER